jgi:tetratricopeptide (TPR) repeat protein
MSGINLPSFSTDWFASAVIAVICAIVAGIVVLLAEKKIRGPKALAFVIGPLVLAIAAVLFWYNAVGIAICQSGRITELSHGCSQAFPAYKRAVAWNPKYTPARERMVVCALQLGRTDEALAVLEPLESALVDTWSYWYELSRCYCAVANSDHMVLSVDRAADIDPGQSAWIDSLAEALHRQFRFTEAEALTRIVRTHNGGDSVAVFWLAWALYEQDKYDDALGHFEKCIEMNPAGYTLSRCIAGKGFTLRDMGRYAEARQPLETSLQMDPTQLDVNAALAQLP